MTDVDVKDVTLNTALINWREASLVSAKVEYGQTQAYDRMIEVVGSSLLVASNSTTLSASGSAGFNDQQEVSNSVTMYTVRLSDLKHSSTYHFRIRAITSDSDEIISDDRTFETLTFPRVTALIMSTDQEINGTSVLLGWSTNGPHYWRSLLPGRQS